jgi:hypothetical protein
LEVAVQRSRGIARLELQNVDEEVKGGISVDDRGESRRTKTVRRRG